MNPSRNIFIENGDPELMENAARIFLERLADRKCAIETFLTLKVDPKLPREGFRIGSCFGGKEKAVKDSELAEKQLYDAIGFKQLMEHGIFVAGGSESAVLYGLGKLLRTGVYKEGKFTPGAWRGTSAPAKPFRAVYLASHFYNFHHCAPLEEMKKYLEDLALLGFNALKLNFPASLFSSDDKPSRLLKFGIGGHDLYYLAGGPEERDRTAKRLTELYLYGKKLGMKAIANATLTLGFPDTPAELRAVPPMSSAFPYDVCPSAPGGLELILKNNEKRFRVAAFHFKPDYFIFWPYDEGGCACPKCRPWGCNGMFRTAGKMVEFCRKFFPEAKFIYGTWLFDHKNEGEWKGLYEHFAKGEGEWCDMLLADSLGDFPAFPLEHGVPDGKMLITFPEVSMWGRYPWGAFGAIAMPEHYSRIFGQSEQISSGGELYSEGIFEDVNKALFASFFWSGNNEWKEPLREYCRYELLSEDTEEFIELIRALERSHAGVRFDICLADDNEHFAWKLKLPENGLPEAASDLEKFRRFEGKLSPLARGTWRWRQLMIRAEMDNELSHCCGKSTEKLESLLEELEKMYRIDVARALPRVAPPTRKYLSTSL